jgi:hypothetical protein
MGSIYLPSVADTAVTTVKELLAFSTLPYYQVSGNLKSGEGAVLIGDPVCWHVGSGKWIKYVHSETQVTSETVFTGTAGTNEVLFALDHKKIVAGSVTVLKDAAPQAEGTDFNLEYDSGVLTLAADLGTGVVLYATYKYLASTYVPAAGFVRIPGDSTSADVPIEVVIGGAVKYSVISVASLYKAQILTDLGARYVVAADAVIF